MARSTSSARAGACTSKRGRDCGLDFDHSVSVRESNEGHAVIVSELVARRRAPGRLALALTAILAACGVQPSILPLVTDPVATDSVAPTPASASPIGKAIIQADFVGTLLHWQVCPLLDAADATYELVLPHKYRVVTRGGRMRIATGHGRVIATEGEVVGILGETVSSGSFCMLSDKHLEVYEIITMSPSSASDDRVRCEDVAADTCDRAVDTALELSPWPTPDITTIRAHPGICAIAMFCPFVDPRFVTVELTVPGRDLAFVTIDSRHGRWAATCYVLVVETSSSHTEPCMNRDPAN